MKRGDGKSGGSAGFFSMLLCVILCFGGGFGGAYVGLKFFGDDGADKLTLIQTGAAEPEETVTGLDAAAESVVEIITTARSSNGWGRRNQSVSEGAGSGVIVSEDGYLVTNNHVIESAETIRVRLRSGETYDATMVGTDEKTDIALLKIEKSGLTPAIIGSSALLGVGNRVYVIGNPLGQLGGTVTEGIISALDREIPISGESMNLLQTDAAVNPGNSGGGMFNARGELVGIVVAKSIGTDVEGLGFAIPIDDVTPVIRELSEHGYVTGRPYLGVTLVDITDEQSMMMYRVSKEGVYVLKVEENSGADKAGIRAGDCIEKVDGKAVDSSSLVSDAIEEKHVGDVAQLTVLRNGQEITCDVVLSEYIPDGD